MYTARDAREARQMMLKISRQIGRCSCDGASILAVISAAHTPSCKVLFDYRGQPLPANTRCPVNRYSSAIIGVLQASIREARTTDFNMTMDLMSSEAPLKMLSMSTGGLGKDTASLLEERTPTTPEGLWRAFLQGSHHHPPPTTQRLDALDRPLSPESPGPALVPPSGVGGRASPSPPPPLTSVCDTHG
ncbi:hypothetical protein Hamer_G020868, partial [Homarus americanus]